MNISAGSLAQEACCAEQLCASRCCKMISESMQVTVQVTRLTGSECPSCKSTTSEDGLLAEARDAIFACCFCQADAAHLGTAIVPKLKP